jgi:thioesterase domain-containing protein/acyl carrier protein
MRLARIWADVLKVARVGRNDNFFELGGHSLLVLRLLMYVESAFGIEIGVAALFKFPTLREFAGCLTSGSELKNAWRIVEIQPLGEKTPIIAINDAMAHYGLARTIGTDRRFFGVHLFDPTEPQLLPPRSLNEIAADYVRIIREAQPSGPYILIGLCIAGVIAYEAAQQLRQAGEQVPLLIMIDSWEPGNWNQRSLSRRVLFRWLRRLSGLKHRLGLLLRRKARLTEILASYHESLVLDFASALRLVNGPMLRREYWLPRWFVPGLEEARNHYRTSAWVGDVVLFQSDEIATFSRLTDAKMGWSDVIKGRLFVHRIRGWHVEVFQEEGTVEIAKHLHLYSTAWTIATV